MAPMVYFKFYIIIIIYYYIIIIYLLLLLLLLLILILLSGLMENTNDTKGFFFSQIEIRLWDKWFYNMI